MSSLMDPERRSTWHDVTYRLKSAFAVLLSLAVLLGGGWFVYHKATQAWQSYRTTDDYPGPGTDEIVVTIPAGATTYRISDILAANDVIKSAKTFDIEAAKNPKANNIQAGQYRLRKQMSANGALQVLTNPENVITQKVTIIEGTRVLAIIQKLAKPQAEGGTGIPLAEYEKAISTQAGDLGLPEYSGGTPEGFLFPDTYKIASDGTAVGVLRQMVTQYNQVADEIALTTKAQQAGMTPLEVLTVASIVENEVRRDEDRAKVARVIYNRLEQGMPLQMDSTVHYAVGKDGSVTTTDEERASKSPYNTYRVQGLPPGPIGSPGRASMVAALTPASGDWLYFVTVNLETGETLFASNYAEHNANVEKFQAWCQANPGRC